MLHKHPNINLFIVGAAKSGTTSLYNYLIKHPDIFFPRVKEPNFYSDAESDNPSDYIIPKKGKSCHKRMIKERSVYFSLYEEAKNEIILADASPSYLWDKNAANRILKDHPNAKIVILLRNPIERAYSHYLMDLKYGNQIEKDFKQAILKDQLSEAKVWGKTHMYIEIGLYYNQIVRYIDVFGEKNVKIILYQDFIKNTKENLEQIFNFLNINSAFVGDIDYEKVHNPYSEPNGKISELILQYKKRTNLIKNVIPTSLKDYLNKSILYKEAKKPKLKEEDKAFLYSFYKEDIEKVEKLLKKDLSSWKVI